MATELYHRGLTWAIRIWTEDETSDVVDTLENLKRNGHGDYEKLEALLRQAADHGPPRNKQKCRQLQGGAECDGIWEFKAPGGTRIAWFYGHNRAIILTHCFRHGDGIRAQCRRASQMRRHYLK